MKIAIDCRYIGMSGIGRVLCGFLSNLPNDHEYYFIGEEEKCLPYKKDNTHIVNCTYNPYSRKGLTKFPKIINKQCDLLIIPNFLVPFGVKIKTYTIIHDLIFLDMKNICKGKIDYLIKKSLITRCFKKSEKIFCDSLFTLNRCNYYYKKYSNKCILNYPGISSHILNNTATQQSKENLIIFVGNVKPHKGIDILVDAFKNLSDKGTILRIIGKKDSFLTNQKFKEDIKNVEFTGHISDDELISEIKKAKFLIQPSLYEGFGLPPIEALLLGTKPVVSNIEVFKEVYEGLDVSFFDINNPKSLSHTIEETSPFFDYKKNKDLIIKKYNYNLFTNKIFSEINK